MYRLFSVIAFVLIISSCGKSLPKLENLDLRAWKDDKNACGNYRYGNIEAVQTQKEKLLALDESKIISLLGRPDRNELFKRNQKFFIYFLEHGPQCDSALKEMPKETSYLSIRFNAMGLAKEITVFKN